LALPALWENNPTLKMQDDRRSPSCKIEKSCYLRNGLTDFDIWHGDASRPSGQWTPSANQIYIFYKAQMADGSHFKIEKNCDISKTV